MNGTGNNVLLCSHSKTGQHWILFFIANYHRILNFNITESIGWEDIPYAQFDKNALRKSAIQQNYREGFPNLRWMEYSRFYSCWIRDLFDSFDKVIYLYRNPYDTMISMFHYFVRTLPGQNRLKIIDIKTSLYFQDYVEYQIPRYIGHIEASIEHANVILYYDQLRRDVSPFKNVVKLFYKEVDDKIFKKALELSSSENIRRIEEIAKKDWEPVKKVWHVRDGRSGQYKEKISKETINYIKNKWDKLKIRMKKRGIKIQ